MTFAKKLEQFSQEVGNKVYGANEMNYYLREVRGSHALIQVKNKKHEPRGFEVWKLRPPHGKFRNKYEIRFPGNEDFGIFGWSYTKLENAEKKLSEVTQ